MNKTNTGQRGSNPDYTRLPAKSYPEADLFQFKSNQEDECKVYLLSKLFLPTPAKDAQEAQVLSADLINCLMDFKYMIKGSSLTYQPCSPALYSWQWGMKAFLIQPLNKADSQQSTRDHHHWLCCLMHATGDSSEVLTSLVEI